MKRELRVDYVQSQRDIRSCFEDNPKSKFSVFDNGILLEEEPENYSRYTDTSEVDMLEVKLGTNIITHKDPRKGIYNMKCISEDLKRLMKEKPTILVSSGAIGLGRDARLKKGELIPESEANAPEQKRQDAIEGQFLLYTLWENHFYPLETEEFLITHDDIRYEQKSKELLRRYEKCLSSGTISVTNEKDKESLEEIEILMNGERVFRDNDELASLIARLLKDAGYNPMLILLSNTDGIYTKESYKNRKYEPIRVVKNSKGLENHAIPVCSTRGRGGMISKIGAAREAAEEGIYTVIADGQYWKHEDAQRKYDVLDSILEGRVVGTRFLPVDYFLR
ncbi:MAG: hypothetical protein U9Q92_04645 [archaeon]|nr:hypothetical protein [archaeon]